MFVGLLFMNIDSTKQLKFVEGSSLSIITEKTNFRIGEKVTIHLINSGTTKLKFTEMLFKITSLGGRSLYASSIDNKTVYLDPQNTKTIIWDQIKNNKDTLSVGRYKITSSAIDNLNNLTTSSIIINIIQ